MWAMLGTLLGGLALGGLQFGSSAYGASMAASSSDRAAQMAYDAQMATNELNYQMFKQNQKWQERMANTAHQREVTDLREAGLNPILSATGGSGAATPSIATPVAQSPGSPVADKAAIYSSLVQGLTGSIGSATEAAERLSKINLNLSTAEKTDKETKQEVGKRTPFMWAANALESNAKSVGDFAKQAGGLLSDIYKGVRSQMNFLQKSFQYNTSRGMRNQNGVYDFGLSDQMNGVRIE